jgi:hypothetical protein
MEPEFNDGDIIIVSPTVHPVAARSHFPIHHAGKYRSAKFIVCTSPVTATGQGRFDNTRSLHPLNPKYPDIVLNKDLEYRIVGIVMEKKKRYSKLSGRDVRQ